MKKTAQQRFLALALLLALSVTLGACGVRSEQTAEKSTVTFRLGFPGGAETLNPYGASTEQAACALSLLYDTLFTMDRATGKYMNSLCQDYTVTQNADGSWLWTLELRSGVLWHDGEPLTAKDVPSRSCPPPTCPRCTAARSATFSIPRGSR